MSATLTKDGLAIANTFNCPASPQHKVISDRIDSPAPKHRTIRSDRSNASGGRRDRIAACPCEPASARTTSAHPNIGRRCGRNCTPDGVVPGPVLFRVSETPSKESASIIQRSKRRKSGLESGCSKKYQRKATIQSPATQIFQSGMGRFEEESCRESIALQRLRSCISRS